MPYLRINKKDYRIKRIVLSVDEITKGKRYAILIQDTLIRSYAGSKLILKDERLLKTWISACILFEVEETDHVVRRS